MKKNHSLLKGIVFSCSLAFFVLFGLSIYVPAHAQGTANPVPSVDLNKPQNNNNSEGAFKLLICDGPAGLNHYNPVTKEIDLTTNNDGSYRYGPKEGYIACDFKGLMIQAQFLINTMVVLGVLAALVGLAYAGSLYVTGAQDKIKKAKEIFPKIAWGFIIMLTAWFIVHQILVWLTGTTNYLQQ